jgi:putative sigma-54 modulation protein
LETIIQSKLEKLTAIYERIDHADIYLKTGDQTMPNAKILEARLSVPKGDLFARAQDDTYEKALAKVVEKLKRQLKKHKAKLSQ